MAPVEIYKIEKLIRNHPRSFMGKLPDNVNGPDPDLIREPRTHRGVYLVELFLIVIIYVAIDGGILLLPRINKEQLARLALQDLSRIVTGQDPDLGAEFACHAKGIQHRYPVGNFHSWPLLLNYSTML
jgi:hypothetical protein